MVLARFAALFSASTLIVCDMFIVSMAYVWSCHRHDKLTYNVCLARFCMWVQHVICLTVIKEEKKVQIHDQDESDRTGT
jgi:hypothetical protein